MPTELNLKSSTIEKGLDLAKGFLDSLIKPALDEVGLLVKDKVTLWRFKNQIKILNKAREHCIKHGISTKEISPKILVPLLEYASLEEDDTLQDKWAMLLSNMVDSEQNVQNHVFPYLLSQISKNEYDALELTVRSKLERTSKAITGLEVFKSNSESLKKDLIDKFLSLNTKPDENSKKEMYKVRQGITDLDAKEQALKSIINKPELFHDKGLKEFEISNLHRRGVIKSVPKHYAYAEPLTLPRTTEYSYYEEKRFDIEVSIEADGEDFILNELGDLFIKACSEKRK